MTFDIEKLEKLRRKYGSVADGAVFARKFREVANRVFDSDGRRGSPFSGVSTFLGAPYRPAGAAPDLAGLDVALVGIPYDLGVSNRPGARLGPRAVRQVERVGPYNQVLECAPAVEMAVADIGDVPFRSRYSPQTCLEDIERWIRTIVEAGVVPLSVGGDHSITHAILRAVGRDAPVGMVHIDAHCDTGSPFEQTKFHHGAPFRNAVLDGVLDPTRTIQIGIRGAAEYLWEFSRESGMEVVHMDRLDAMGIPGVIELARQVVGDGPVYVSFDIDSLDPAFAPGTGTPEIGGLTTREALRLLHGLKGIDIVGGDVVEVAPQYDATTNTAHAGAQILFDLLSLIRLGPSVPARLARHETD